MIAIYPLHFEWTDEGVMRPLNPRAADRQYVVGEHYFLDHREDRSAASHRAFFAEVNECFENLPAHLAERFGSAEALRKYALIRAGFRDERSIVCSSKAEAQKIAAFVRTFDEFAVVSTSGTAVVVLTAKSQSMRAMGKAEFQRSKDAVLRVLSEMLGVSSDALQQNAAERAA